MTSILPPILTGEVVPGVIDPNISRSHFTNIPYGPPIAPPTVASVPMAPASTKPRPTGDERHGAGGLAEILQKVMQKQGQGAGPGAGQGAGGAEQAPVAQSLPGYRDWRG